MNASAHLVTRVARAGRQRLPSTAIVTAVLPTEWHTAPSRLSALIARHAPAAAVHFGVSSQVSGFAIERLAHNACRVAPDAAGRLPPAEVVHASGPDRRETRLPVEVIVSRLRALDIPVSVSDDAGRYLCNSLLYHSLGHAEANTLSVAGFVHIPAALGKIGGPLGWDKAVAGALEIIDASLAAAAGKGSRMGVTRRNGPLRSTGH